MAAYTLARKKFRGADAILMLILSSMMIPLHIRVIPMYLVSLNLGLQNTYTGIFLPISITGFGIFLMRQFFITLPKEVEYAARVDGCGEWGTLFFIVLPMSRPAITSLAIFAFTWSIEDFLWPLIITTEVNMRPLSVGMTLFFGLQIYEWGAIMATATLAVLPVVIIYLLLQRYFIEGITAGAVKG
jgi:ABC-type glycerol-3-phosphate transport system permease component